MKMRLLETTRSQWSAMTLYHRFEQIICWVLMLFVAVIVAVTTLRLVVQISQLMWFGAINPLQPQELGRIFGMLMTVLIALEFNHSIYGVVERRHRIVQVKTVVLISILTLLRRFIVVDIGELLSASTIAAMALAVLALGIVYWLMRERDDRRVDEPVDRAA
ncbi:MAG: hypothetical protein JWM53_986 [bacterium]|nr:hypothetical protein [bacterium]